MRIKCGLLGAKLGHSYSPEIHAHLGDYPYLLHEKTPEEIGDFLNNEDFTGLNVTVPYKKAVIPYCGALSPAAEKLGAVNTIIRKPDGTLWGHNTDYFGFEAMLKRSGLSVADKKVLVLGSGGASNTVVAVLRHKCANVVVISRTGENNYENLSLHRDAAVIVNTTPVGMYPHNGATPLSLDIFPDLEGVLDLIYNPARTQLLQDAAQRGLVALNGLYMLVAQAKESAEYFTSQTIDDSIVDAIHSSLRRQMENITLIGMPGCGKSTVGAILAQKTGRKFVDTDAEIEKKAGCSIPEIFAKQGEAAFRALETQVLEELGKSSGLIIATGGGCVTQERNYPLLHQNAKIFCIHRELSELATDGRPLSQNGQLEKLYAVRKPMYNQFADHHIDNSGSPDAAATEILRIWEETE